MPAGRKGGVQRGSAAAVPAGQKLHPRREEQAEGQGVRQSPGKSLRRARETSPQAGLRAIAAPRMQVRVRLNELRFRLNSVLITSFITALIDHDPLYSPSTVPREQCNIERGKPICILVPVEDCSDGVALAVEECREVPHEVCQDVLTEVCDENVATGSAPAGGTGNEIDSEIVGQALDLVKVRCNLFLAFALDFICVNCNALAKLEKNSAATPELFPSPNLRTQEWKRRRNQ